MPSGEQLKTQGQQLVLSNESEEWKERAWNTIIVLARNGQPFTSEDVRAVAGDPERPNSVGAIFARAVKAGVIIQQGWTKASRLGMHATDLRVWVGWR